MITAAVAAQGTAVVIRSQPLPSPQDIANLESHVLEVPEDVDARTQLLRLYLDAALPPGHVDPSRQSLRLQHILYLVEHHPEAAVSGSKLAYVGRSEGAYANAADHEAVRDRWLAAEGARSKDRAVTMNAVKFLQEEDPDDAEHVLRRAVEDEPESREFAANLGFLYAREIKAGRDRAVHAMAELEQSSSAVLLAAAGTALSNLAKSFDAVNESMLDFAGKLLARARELAPDDADIQSPMPLIKYFAAAQEGGGIGTPAASLPSRIRVGENVQAVNLIRKTEPEYPEEARKAGIGGEVRLSATIGRDGTVQNIQLVSGHPLLVEAAIQAAQTWVYKPTLLNGSPVEVVTTVTVAFPPN
jgi:TonB family protein